MQKRSNINFNSAGIGGCVGLLCLLLAMMVAPLTPSAVFAVNEDNHDDEAMATAGTTTRYETSTVDIAFTRGVTSGADGNKVTAPSVTTVTDNDGRSRTTIDTKISVTNSKKYEVYIGSDSQYLRRDGTSDEDRLNPVSGNPTFTNIGTNEWGYAWAPKDEFNEDTVTYSAMPGTVRGVAFDQNNAPTDGKDEREYTISFAANFGTGMKSGTYSSKVTLSVISSPTEITVSGLTSIANMQDMAKSVCDASSRGDENQLLDTRDNKYYWVAKFDDDRCWMTQNLALDLGTVKKGNTTPTTGTNFWPEASKSDYDTTPSTNLYSTANYAGSNTLDNSTSPFTRSWDFGNWKLVSPTAYSSCGNGKEEVTSSTCSSIIIAASDPKAKDTSVNHDAHYNLGNYYQWDVAVAGSDGSKSICPKGWTIPSSTEIGNLLTAYDAYTGSTAGVTAIVTQLYFARSGYVYQTDSSTGRFRYAGYYGYYWSSTPNDGTTAYRFDFSSTNNINPSSAANRNGGYSVRCIARNT